MENTLVKILATQKKVMVQHEPETRQTHGKLTFVWVKTETSFLSPIEWMLAIKRYKLPIPPGRTAEEYTGYCNARRVRIGEAIYFDHSNCPHNAATLEEQLELISLEWAAHAEWLKNPKNLEEYVLSNGGTYKGKSRRANKE